VNEDIRSPAPPTAREAERSAGHARLTRREIPPSGGDTVATTRREESTGAYVRMNLPPELADSFEVVGEVASGGESDVLLVRRRDRGDARTSALKIYRHGLEPDPEALAVIRALPHEHVVAIYDCGQSTAGWWEEQEYAEYGSLADLIQTEGPRLGRHRLRDVIVELAGALEAVHPVLHRDVKPTNVFVRTLQPLDLVLGDFGLARSTLFTHIVSTVAGSLAYQSPEALDGGASPARDWWAVGMIVAEAAMGRHPYCDPELGWPAAPELRIALATRPVPLDGIPDERVLLLCRGLLVRDPRRRWGLAEVRSWLAGGTPPIVDESAAKNRSASVQPLVFCGERATTPKGLAPLLAQHWDDALRLVSGAASEAADYVRLTVWLQEHEHERGLRVLEQSARDRSFARRLFRLLRTLDPDLPPSFRGRIVDREGLLALAKAAASGETEAQRIAYDVFELGIVGELAREEAYADLVGIEERWRDELELVPRLRDELGSLGKPLEDDDLLHVVRGQVLLPILDVRAMDELAETVGAADQPALARSSESRELFERIVGDGTQPIRLIAAMIVLEPARERYEHELAEHTAARALRDAASARIESAASAIERGLQAIGRVGAQIARDEVQGLRHAVARLTSAIDAIPDDIDHAVAVQEQLRTVHADALQLECEAQRWAREPLVVALGARPDIVDACEAAGVPGLDLACQTVLERDGLLERSRGRWKTYADAVDTARAVGVNSQLKLSPPVEDDESVATMKWCVAVQAQAASIVEEILEQVSSKASFSNRSPTGAGSSREVPLVGAVAASCGILAVSAGLGAAIFGPPGLLLPVSPFVWIVVFFVARATYRRLKERDALIAVASDAERARAAREIHTAETALRSALAALRPTAEASR
jgi:Protein kinase domain